MNVVVFVLQGCPVSALGCYGNEWIVTDRLDRLAAEGVVFDRHVSDCPDPTAARRTWREGLALDGVRSVLVCDAREPNAPSAEFRSGWDEVIDVAAGPTDESPADSLVRELPAILDRLVEHPRWLLWLELDWLLPPWHVPADLFTLYTDDLTDPDEPTDDEDEDEDEDDPDEEGDDPDEEGDDPDEEGEDRDEDRDDENDEPAVEALEPAEPLIPWTDPPVGPFDRDDIDSWELLHRTYAAAVTAVDGELGRVFDILRERGIEQTAGWVLTADFGFPLGEHGFVGPSRALPHDEFVHLPLVVRLPMASGAGDRVSGLTTPADLASLLTGMTAENAAEFRCVESTREEAITRATVDGESGYSLRTPQWTLILPPADVAPPQLYEHPADRREMLDVSGRDRAVADDLEARLRAAITPPR